MSDPSVPPPPSDASAAPAAAGEEKPKKQHQKQPKAPKSSGGGASSSAAPAKRIEDYPIPEYVPYRIELFERLYAEQQARIEGFVHVLERKRNVCEHTCLPLYLRLLVLLCPNDAHMT